MSKAPLLPHLNKMKILGNKYIGDEIGKGASGRVFKGLDIENGDFVAIKQVSLENVKNDDIKAIMQEIDLLKVLSHKNIVKYLGSLNTETDLHIILEYVENGSLDNIIKPNKFGPFPESLAAVYIAQVLEGLTYLHEQGVIHRDIKGANILATKEGLVKLTDFGVATKLTEAVVNTTHSSSSIAGTPYWMAPEVIVLSGACAASDIWSVGCTVIELLTCVPPYHDLAHYSALYHIVKDVMPPIPAQLSPEITDFLHQCFKKDAKQRPDARTLLLHPWIRNSARNLQSSVRQTGGSLRISQPRVSVDSESSFGDDDQSSGESHRDASDTELEQEAIGTMPDKDAQSDQDLAFSSHEKLSIRSSSDSPPSAGVEDPSDPERSNEHSSTIDHNEGMLSGEVSSLNSRKEGIIAGEYEGGGRSSLHPRMRRRSTRKDADFNKLLGSLKPDEPEDVILSACRKLIAFFDECPDEKTVFLHQHGLLPLMDLLEVPKNSVIPSVLQIINQIVKENAYFQEYACSLGLIPVVMNFAVPGCPKEVRTQAAYFLQQLCESRSSTLHMFIACRGIHVLVGFLEADYAKYREMVHLAVDGMWQILKLQCSTRRNDFCHIAAMNGILPRLVHTLHSLNEATRLAASSADGSSPAFSLAPEPYSIPQDPGQHISMQGETPDPCSGKIDSPEFMLGTSDHPLPARNMGVSRTSSSHSLQEVSVNSILQKHANKQQAGNSMSTDLIDNTCQEWKRSDSWKNNSSLAERHQGVASPAGGSIDKPQKQVSDGTPGVADSLASQHDKVRPLLIVLDKEPPSRRGSGKFEYMRQSSGLARLGNRPPLLHASAEWKTTNELDFLMAEFEENKKIRTPVMVSTSCNERVSSTFGVTPRATSAVLSGSGILNAIPGRNASSGLLSFDKDVSREYLEKVADLLLEFAQAGTKVKFRMCGISLVSCLFHMFQKLEPPILLKILKCINHLSTDANCLENLQRANAIKHLIPNLELREHPLAPQIHNEVLNALFNLCKINKVMQEQAANNGLVPHLMHFIMSGSPLKQYAVPMLCDMAHASGASREQLRAHDCLGVYLSLLDDELWSVMALDSLAACLAHDDDCKKVEQALLKKDAIQKLVKFFQCCPDQYFVNISEPFLKIITKSPRINTTLAVSGLTPFLMARLNHHDAIVRITLLKMIKVVYEHHPRPKQIIVENDMPRKLENLIKEQSRDGQRSGGQVLVKQLATALLKALHINTVL